MLRESTRARRRRTWWTRYRDAERRLRSADDATREEGVRILGELDRTAVSGEDLRMVAVLVEVHGIGGTTADPARPWQRVPESAAETPGGEYR